MTDKIEILGYFTKEELIDYAARRIFDDPHQMHYDLMMARWRVRSAKARSWMEEAMERTRERLERPWDHEGWLFWQKRFDHAVRLWESADKVYAEAVAMRKQMEENERMAYSKGDTAGEL